MAPSLINRLILHQYPNRMFGFNTFAASLLHSLSIYYAYPAIITNQEKPPYFVPTLAQKCLFSFSQHDAQKLHLDIIKHGVAKDLYLCNTLINLYVKNADLISVPDVFDEIPSRNLVTWACLITGYSQNGMPDEACRVFQEMVTSGFVPNHYACGSALRSCQGLGDCGLSCGGNGDHVWRFFVEIDNKNSVSCNSIISVYAQRGTVYAFELLLYAKRGYRLLANIEKSGLLEDLYEGSALLSGFGRFRSLDTEMKVFKQMGARNAVSLNGLMVGLVRLGQGEEAAKVFVEMRDLVNINSDSFVVLFSAFPKFSSLEEGEIRGRELHAYVIRTGLCNSMAAIGNALINVYSKFGEIQIAHSVFQVMVDKDSVSWNSMISALDENGCFEDAISTFQTMRRTGLMASSNYSLISALSSCGSLNWIRLGEQLHSEGIKSGLDFDVSVSNTLLALYADTGCVAECKKLFTFMPEHDLVSWNSMIGALALVLKYSAMDANSIENTFLACYGKCGEMDDCENIFSGMSDRKDDVSWNLMISGYLHNEVLPKAMDLVWLMLQKGQKLDGFTFAFVLSACTVIATLEHGMEVHACAIRACLESDFVVGSALIDMYAKCGRIDYASRFFDVMPVRNIYSWNSMISYAWHGHGHKALELFTKMKLEDLGMKAAHMLLELEPLNAVNYVLLANMYASRGKWEDVAEARHAMREATVRKEAGCSWVSMRDGVHVFVADDQSHQINMQFMKNLRNGTRGLGMQDQMLSNLKKGMLLNEALTDETLEKVSASREGSSCVLDEHTPMVLHRYGVRMQLPARGRS
ncbi:hypothetical protein BC332_15523 [Capsicum chinense]|nr:hypothetical protein BC332_15523 [Capsicum chinense]